MPRSGETPAPAGPSGTGQRPLPPQLAIAEAQASILGESGILFPGQTEVPDAGKVNATWVFEKRDGQWLIAAYHNSPVLAPGQ